MSLEVREVNKVYNRKLILDRINLQIEKGEFFVVLGPSGSGKTTLLRIIAGLEKPDNGKILIDNTDVTNIPAGKRNIGMVFQNYALYPSKRIWDNLFLPLESSGMGKEEATKRIEFISKRLGIDGLLQRFPGELSGGQQQRVALARALVKTPRLFLMDEPLSNLDAPQRVSARKLIKEIQEEYSITSIYVTHDQTEAMALGDRICIIDEGKILQIGTPEEIYDDPADEKVASFIGNPPMSLLDGSIIGEKGNIGVRAEDVILEEGDMKGKVINSEFLGDRYLVHISLGSEELMAFSKVRLREGVEVSFRISKFKQFR
ncbi:ABC transporter ATP-binding protein [Sulfuracidifex tepidarius]|uniref:Trehalose/maltose import ATP-binding protein MalK n=1 Tax=Sulfuracidifex tepidarius TaxID=1294262 RepID=A0A510E4S4_9CREN|nr:ABC transporter ATP-binding protein [Sulfuracidifex tepidarius]BBG27058.1 Trehalose/maltose import ATP-binding protein MalK [Sulfuracidifex tepidarius]